MKNFRIKITHQNTEPSVKENQPQMEVGPFDADDSFARSFSYNDLEILKIRKDSRLIRIDSDCSKFVEVYEYQY
jgi:hypothetical protein